MLILISPAKTFANYNKVRSNVNIISNPIFEDKAFSVVRSALQLSSIELRKQLGTSPKVFEKSLQSLISFIKDENLIKLPSLIAYSGMVFKKIKAKDFSNEDWVWANRHLMITSFVYGLLSPTDLIKPYRMEGDVILPNLFRGKVFDYWKPILTDLFISRIKENNSELLFLASQEMKKLFDWGRVEREVRVVEPMFNTIKNSVEVKQIVIYTKMCRGTMTNEIIKQRINNIESIKYLSPEGFVFSANDSNDNVWNYYRK